MQRYFIKTMNVKENTASIVGADFHHIKNVMRSKQGDNLIVCQDGVCYIATINEITAEAVLCSLQKEIPSDSKEYTVTIAQGLIRRERFEYMLQKSTELGVDKIIPMMSQYSIIKVDSQKGIAKVDRWNKITKEASEQSHRNIQSIVTQIQDIRSIQYNQFDLVLVAYERENMSHTLKQILQDKFKNILVLIGPEGGLSEVEIQFLSGYSNVEFVGLGQRILRSETASSYILSVLNYQYEMKL
jgi:16S rRNA (uracil1498-N3)-methyltransferase